MKNTLKEKLESGKPVLGEWMMTNSFDTAQIMSHAGADCIMIDAEHGAMDLESAGRLVNVIATTKTVPLLRVPWNDIVMVKRGLDTGCAGIMIPMINTAEEAEKAVSFCKYPPLGKRGVGAGRATLFGALGSAYYPYADKEVLVILQIEHPTAVKNVEEILKVPGIDIAFVGPVDLSMNMGEAGVFTPPMLKAFKKVVDACEAAGVVPGIMTNPGNIKRHLDLGFRFLLGGIDGQFIYDGATAIVEEFNRAIE